MARQSALLPFTRSWCVPACLRARVVMTTAVVAAGVAGGGCERIQEDGPAFDEEDVRDVKDVRDVVAPDIPKIIDTLKFDAKPKKDLIVADVPDPTPESCDNGSDDDDDGLIDEAGCEPGPNLRPDQTWTDLGTVSLVEQAGPAPTLPFGVSVKNQGTVLVARDISATRRYVWAESLTSPAGVQVLTPGAWATSLNRGAVGLGYGTATLGMSPKVNVLAGPWQTGFVRADVQPAEYPQVPTPGTLHVGVLSRPEIPGVQAAALDLDVWCAGSVPMPCKELEASWQWQQLAARVELIWKPAGLRLGKVTFRDLDGQDGEKFRFLDNVLSGGNDNEFTAAAAAIGQRDPKSTAFSLILTAAIYDKGQPIAAGLSQLGGVPGMAGSRLSAMTVAIDDAEWKVATDLGPASPTVGDRWGVTVAHEIGHFLGLWHTDEFHGQLHDPIDDTPTCDKDVDVLTAEACPIQSKYLMFWTPKGTTVTAGQVKVVRLSPALRQAN